MKAKIAIAAVGTLLLTALLLSHTAIAGGHGGHGGHGGFFGLDESAHKAIHQLIQDLQLDDAQQEKLGDLHRALAGHMESRDKAHRTHVHLLLKRLEAGPLDATAARAEIDVFLEQTRHELYQAVDAMTALVNSLDARQQGILQDHLAEARHHAEEHAAHHAAMQDAHGSSEH